LSLPDMATYGNNVYVVWASHNDGSSDVYFKSIRVGGGASFGNTINLSHDAGFSGSPQVAANGNNVYVMWEDNSTRNSDIYFKASKNSGASFGNRINLSHDAGFSGSPQVAANGNNVYVMWEDKSTRNSDIYFKASKNSGASFGN